MKKLTIKNLSKSYDGNLVIPNINLDINEGEFVVFVGPSGCGKSTLLRMIAGLESVTQGTIQLNERILNTVHPSNREVAMVFQSYALYPHMTVEKNIGFPLKMAGVPAEQIKQKVMKTARNLQLEPFLQRLPGALSGGQRQRVAIGRAIVRDPEIFLFDEPLSNLDAKLRGEMRVYLKQLHQQLNATMVYVTHDQVEAMTLADKIVVLNQGHIEQIGAPETLYDRPANRFVASFIGSPVMNFLPFEQFAASLGHQTLANSVKTIGIRPNQVVTGESDHSVSMVIDVVEPLGHARLYYGNLAQGKFVIESDQRFEVGQTIEIDLKASTVHLFDVNDQRVELDEVANAA